MGMMQMGKAPTDAELLAGYEATEALRARRMNVASLIDNVTRGGRSLSQVKRTALARIVIALGGTVTTATTRTAMVVFIEREMA